MPQRWRAGWTAWCWPSASAKDDKYRQVHGLLTGTRQRIEDQIDAAADDALALSQIDVAAGWPAAPCRVRQRGPAPESSGA